MPSRLQLSRKAGWRLPLNAKSVARPGRWGNPFRVRPSMVHPDEWVVLAPGDFMGSFSTKASATRAAVDLHRAWLHEELQVNILLVEAFVDLKGLDLACWCDLKSPCHADNLLRELANS